MEPGTGVADSAYREAACHEQAGRHQDPCEIGQAAQSGRAGHVPNPLGWACVVTSPWTTHRPFARYLALEGIGGVWLDRGFGVTCALGALLPQTPVCA